jgi:hypothetical protein
MPGLNIVNMREGIRKATGIEDGDPDLTTAQIDLYLNRALWEIDNKFPFKEKEKTVTFETVSAERNYDVPTNAGSSSQIWTTQTISRKFQSFGMR